MTQENLINWIREQAQRVSIWAYLERMGSEGGIYHAGYLQALEEQARERENEKSTAATVGL